MSDEPRLSILGRARRLVRRLRRDQRGNVLMIVGLSIIPLTFATGMGIDYSRAMKLQTKLNAAADAAALAAVTTPMMNQSAATACAAAKAMFVQQASGLNGLIINTDDNSQLNITLTQNDVAANCNGIGLAGVVALKRDATVTYRGQSQNAFAGILGLNTLVVKGTSEAYAAVAPNIDFYLMLDTSPSMLLPATAAGLATQTSKTTTGCAFACHQTTTSATDPGGTPMKNGVYEDYYQIARDNNLVLRTDLVTEAVQDLTTFAATTSATNKATYRMGISDFDYMYRQIYPTAPIAGFNVTSDLPSVKTHVTDATILTYCTNNNRTCGGNDNDTGTNFTAAFTGALATMPAIPGNGTKNAGDTPQAMLFIITDGMRDESNGGRQIGPIPTAQCTTIKNRGIRIAILYTEYLPASASDSWSQTNVKAPYLSPTDKISPPLISCASPGLYYKVSTDDDISAALTALFQKAVATAQLLK